MAKEKAQKEPGFDFEKALKELEQLVEKMEEGELSLEESLKHFERGIALTRACQQALQSAEQKVQILLNEGDKQNLAAFDSQAAEDDNNNNAG
ncbi:MAG: exodeoxyribonuclease VII small subunit [Gammaproteobacteria bacterium]|nr:exodeoxyribonuclease VII small subunit [Gammaproteobacteria bacterium]